MPVEIGDTAPEFTLKNQDSEDMSLSDYKGENIVLLFFPFAFSSVCTKEMRRMQDEFNNNLDLDAQVIGISVDSPYTLKIFRDMNKLNFNLLSDFNKEVSRKYDSLYELYNPEKYSYNGVSKRSAFVIGRDGKIKYKEICPTPGDQPDYDSIKKTLEND
ncbi:MAG TPA: redoxin domain-containing protein [Ignavibacteriaceae bacterium]|nr:redoxin domain-containing protein [Ignavibacteriaceae bacterium]